MNIKTQRLVAILVLAVAIAFGGGIYLLQDAWKTSSDLDSSNQILIQENEELKEQLKQIPILIQEGSSQGESAGDSSAGDSSSGSPSLAQAEEVTKACMQAYFTHDSTTSPREKWEAFSPYLTEKAAEKYRPSEEDSSSSSSDTSWASSCEFQRIYSKSDEKGAETFALLLNTTTVQNDKNKNSTQSVVAVKCHLSVADGEWKIDQLLTVNTNIGPYQFAS